MRVVKSLGKSIALAALLMPLGTTIAEAAPSAKSQRVIDYWTPERMQRAIPRQLVIAPNGLGYLKMPDGSLQPHGHDRLVALSKASPEPRAKPGSGSDNEAPVISNRFPDDGAKIDASSRFAADITDDSGLRSVNLIITYPDGRTQSFGMSSSDGVTWENTLSGFTDSNLWQWRVEAKDASSGKGNTAVSPDYGFTVDTSGGGGEPPPPTGGDIVTNGLWRAAYPDLLQAGRIYFEMPTNKRLNRWAGYVCSGTVATDGANNGRSVIITAAHCAYDDANKAFARNVLFIPNQDATTGSRTDSNCSNDPVGCWAPDFAVVDTNWTNRTFPDNIPWDYAYYVVPDSDAHSAGFTSAPAALDSAVTSLPISFSSPAFNTGSTVPDASYTHGIGYSYSDDPNLMYCAENMTTQGSDNWWLASCGLSGGSSGGPWIQPAGADGQGDIISVNSWGYSTSPGMAGPKLSGTSAECLFGWAQMTPFGDVPNTYGQQGIDVNFNTDCP